MSTETPREISRRRMTAAFDEWMRRAKEEPDRYQLDLATIDATTYGEVACEYFCKLLAEQPLEVGEGRAPAVTEYLPTGAVRISDDAGNLLCEHPSMWHAVNCTLGRH